MSRYFEDVLTHAVPCMQQISQNRISMKNMILLYDLNVS